MRPILALMLTVAMSLLASEVGAAGPRRAQQQHGHVSPQAYNRYQQQMYWKSTYPKYQAGFNSRALENLGVPSGDVGLRGSPYHYGYGNPW